MTTEQFIQEMSELTGAPMADFRANVPEGTELGRTNLDGNPGAQAVWKKAPSLMRAGDVPLPERVNLYDKKRHDISYVPPTIAGARIAKYPGRFTMIKPVDWHDSDPAIIEETCEVCIRDPERPATAERPKFTSWDQLQEHYEFFHERSWQRMERDRIERERRDDKNMMASLIGTLISVMRPDVQLPEAVREQIEDLQGHVSSPSAAAGPEPRRGRRVRVRDTEGET